MNTQAARFEFPHPSDPKHQGHPNSSHLKWGPCLLSARASQPASGAAAAAGCSSTLVAGVGGTWWLRVFVCFRLLCNKALLWCVCVSVCLRVLTLLQALCHRNRVCRFYLEPSLGSTSCTSGVRACTASWLPSPRWCENISVDCNVPCLC